MKLSISLSSAKQKAQSQSAVGAAPSLKRPAAFANLDDDDTMDAAPTASSSSGVGAGNKAHIAQFSINSSLMKKKMEAEKKVDQTVYEYDEVWDKMQEAKQRAKEAKEVDTKVRKPKYIEGLLNTAATRRLDHLRAEEKMMQREREAEGDEFADKDVFVTQAYKDQMEEVRLAEEEEKKRDELAKKNTGITTGMSHMYRQLLEQSEQNHEAAVAATKKPVVGPQPNLTIQRPPEMAPKSDAQLAEEARASGKDVELNDDNQIVDKRELLAAGLNLSAPNTRNLAGLNRPSKSKDTGENVIIHTAVGTAASRREINARRAREIQKQMEDEQTRAADENAKREAESLRRVIERRNDESDVQSARERYLARKRQKLEQESTEQQPA